MNAPNRIGSGGHKPRQDRRRVLIPARMKQGLSWTDVCIRNMSSRGLLLQGRSPPSPGSYVEIRRDNHIIVARVIWSNQNEFGAHAQDFLPIDQIIRGPEGAISAGDSRNEHQAERRAVPRPSFDRSHEASRQLSSVMQYGFMIIVGLSLAIATVSSVRKALISPLAIASANL